MTISKSNVYSKSSGREEQSDIWVENGRLTFRNFAAANNYFASLKGKSLAQILDGNIALGFNSRYASNLTKQASKINAYLQTLSQANNAKEIEEIRNTVPNGSEAEIPDNDFLAILSPEGEIGISKDSIYKTDGNYCLIYHKNKQQQATQLLSSLNNGSLSTDSKGKLIDDILAYKAIIVQKTLEQSPSEITTNSSRGGRIMFNSGHSMETELWAGWWVIRSSAGARTGYYGWHCNWFWCQWYQRNASEIRTYGVFDGYYRVGRQDGQSIYMDLGVRNFDTSIRYNSGDATSYYEYFWGVPMAPAIYFYGFDYNSFTQRTFSYHYAKGGNNNAEVRTQYLTW